MADTLGYTEQDVRDTILGLSVKVETALCRLHSSIDNKFDRTDEAKVEPPTFIAPNVIDVIIHNLEMHQKHIEELMAYMEDKVLSKVA